jgi:hypothetical protein
MSQDRVRPPKSDINSWSHASRLHDPGGKRIAFAGGKLARLGIRGRLRKAQREQQSFELEYARAVEGLDVLGMGNGAGHFRGIAIRVRATAGVDAEQRLLRQRMRTDHSTAVESHGNAAISPSPTNSATM